VTRRAWTRHLKDKGKTEPRSRKSPCPVNHLIDETCGRRNEGNARVHERMQIYPIRAVPKPTMTHADRWNKRPPVLRYRAYGDLLRWHRASLPTAYLLVACFTPPASLSGKKRLQMIGYSHQVKPDASNLQKALEDHLMPNADQKIYDGRCIKLWGHQDLVCIIDTRGLRLEIADVALIAHARTMEEIPMLSALIPASGETQAG